MIDGSAATGDKSSSGSAWVWTPGSGRVPDYRTLARFASVSALEGLNLRLDDAYRLAIEDRPARGTAEHRAYLDRRRDLVCRLYERMRARGYKYDNVPWHVGGALQQRIRDPRLIDRTSGTCLDLALMFSGACKANGLRPYLVAVKPEWDQQSGRVRSGHAIVIVALDRDYADERPTDSPVDYAGPVKEVDTPDGVWRYTPVRASYGMSAAEDCVAVDMTCACSADLDFDKAVSEGERILSADAISIDVLDVIRVHFQTGDPGAAPPAEDGRPAIYRRLPSRSDFTAYTSRREILAKLTAARGTVALIGDTGIGKSMLAHHIAQTADEGSGWFLDASTRVTSETELAQALAGERGTSLIGLEAADLGGYARLAIQLLEASTLPWVVVLDNANDGPGALGRYPRPNPEYGQKLIITTTSRAWEREVDFPEELGPLEETEVQSDLDGYVPASVLTALAGRPLLVEAAKRFHSATKRHWWQDDRPDGEPEAAGSAESAPSVFWERARQALAHTPAAIAMAQTLTWYPPAAISLTALAAATNLEQSEATAAAVRLWELGVIDLVDGKALMHRLIREAVHTEAVEVAAADQLRIVLAMLSASEALRPLEQAADLESSSRMHDLVKLHASPEQMIIAVHQLAQLIERYDVPKAAEWYDEVLTLLEWTPGGDIPPRHRLRAINGLRGQAREVFRNKVSSRYPEAIAWTLDAKRLGAGVDDRDTAVAVWEAHAMRGLIIRSQGSMAKGTPEGLSLLKEAEQILTESFEKRKRLYGTDDLTGLPSLDRGRYNIAGLQIGLAQADDRAHIGEHLAGAKAVYSEILTVREARYQTRAIEEVACCVNGLALVAYYQCLLQGGSPLERIGLIREARTHASEAVDLRCRAAGRQDSDDVAKSLELLVKISLLELRLAGPNKDGTDRGEQAISQFRHEAEPLHGTVA
jgi:hypothetical protein